MEENKNPTYEEWKAKYPNSTLNEYYSWIRKNGVMLQTKTTEEPKILKEETISKLLVNR